jgi:hypothetical protein
MKAEDFNPLVLMLVIVALIGISAYLSGCATKHEIKQAGFPLEENAIIGKNPVTGIGFKYKLIAIRAIPEGDEKLHVPMYVNMQKRVFFPSNTIRATLHISIYNPRMFEYQLWEVRENSEVKNGAQSVFIKAETKEYEGNLSRKDFVFNLPLDCSGGVYWLAFRRTNGDQLFSTFPIEYQVAKREAE